MIFNHKLILSVMLSSLLLVACGDKGEHKSAGGQVVAKVNGDEISVHQVNLQLGRVGKVTEEQSKEVSKKIVAKLVDQQLLVQQATAAKLDRDPRVLQVIEASKAEILAQAYIEQVISKAQKPSTSEIDTFYNEHPELFAKRRVFRIQELVVTVSPEKFADIEAGVKGAKNINEIATWLKDNKYPFNVNSNVKPAEQLPGDLLKLLQPLKDGENILLKTNSSINIVNLAASQEQALPRDKATPVIEQYFLNRQKSELAKKEMEALRSKAKVEYLGEFASMKDATAAKTETKTVEQHSETAASTSGNAEGEKKADQSAIDKGLSGM
ncbi:MAG TPA: peptidyl-prolyl cis-trans isomerase, EpsD family [Methylophilaceae bacterium]|nr:peptidyl-prolyl cis-trans isomerase, EpsD family [Methylophilaceae bacterium]